MAYVVTRLQAAGAVATVPLPSKGPRAAPYFRGDHIPIIKCDKTRLFPDCASAGAAGNRISAQNQVKLLAAKLLADAEATGAEEEDGNKLLREVNEEYQRRAQGTSSSSAFIRPRRECAGRNRPLNPRLSLGH